MRGARPTCRPRDRDRRLPRECGWGGQCREPLILSDCLCFTQLIRLPKREQQESTKFARILREQGREREHMRCLHATTVVQFTSYQNSALALAKAILPHIFSVWWISVLGCGVESHFESFSTLFHTSKCTRYGEGRAVAFLTHSKDGALQKPLSQRLAIEYHHMHTAFVLYRP